MNVMEKVLLQGHESTMILNQRVGDNNDQILSLQEKQAANDEKWVQSTEVQNHLLSELAEQKAKQVEQDGRLGGHDVHLARHDGHLARHDGQIEDVQYDVKRANAQSRVAFGMAVENKEGVEEAHEMAVYLREGQKEIRDKQEEQDDTMHSIKKVARSIISNMPSGEGKDKVKKDAKEAGIRLSDASSVQPLALDHVMMNSRGRTSDGSGGFGGGIVNDDITDELKGEEEGLKPAAKERSDSNVTSIGDRPDPNNGSTNPSTNDLTNDSSDSNIGKCPFLNPDAL